MPRIIYVCAQDKNSRKEKHQKPRVLVGKESAGEKHAFDFFLSRITHSSDSQGMYLYMASSCFVGLGYVWKATWAGEMPK